MLLSGREPNLLPTRPAVSVLGLHPPLADSVACAPSLLPLFGRSRKKKQNSFPLAVFLFEQILGGGKICPSILNWYQRKTIFPKIPISHKVPSVSEVSRRGIWAER